jgi:hypothetical protein
MVGGGKQQQQASLNEERTEVLRDWIEDVERGRRSFAL